MVAKTSTARSLCHGMPVSGYEQYIDYNMENSL